MGVVYRAVQLDLGRPVALKLIAADRAADPDFRERFQRESRMAAAIDHPNVVPVHGAGEEDGQLYLVMRYVRGTDLHALIKREGPLAPERAAAIVAQVASALDAAHAAGLVHRDVKPANVLLGGSEREEHAYLSDFGLTRLLASETQLTETGQWMGTIDFSAPEQLSADRIDARADVYSLGCVLHAALVGTPPFPRSTLPATLLAHMQDPMPRPSERGAPSGFDRVHGAGAGEGARGPLPVRRRPRPRGLRGGARRARDRVRAQRRGRLRRRPTRPPTATPGRRPPRPRWTRRRRGDRGRPRGRRRRSRGWSRRRMRARGAGRGTRSPLIPPPPGEAPDAAPRPPPRGRARRLAARGRRGGRRRSPSRSAAEPARATPRRRCPRATSATSREDFAQAYEAEDGAALRRMLTPGVQRVLPSGVARGRGRVVNEYERQFRSQDTRGYELEDLEAQRRPGRPRERRLPRRPQGRRGDRGPDRVRRRARPRTAADRADRRHALGLSAQQARATMTRTVVPRRTCGARRRLLLADAQALRHERVEEAAAALALEAEAAARDAALGVVDTVADEVRDRTRCSRVTRKAVSAAERLRAVAATSMTFGPGSSETSERKRPPLTCARRPWTCTCAVLGLTVPLTCTVLPSTSAVSDGLETRSFTGGFGFGGALVSRRSRRRRRPRGPRR